MWEFLSFWCRCISRSWQMSYGAFALLEGFCGIVAALALVHKLPKWIPKKWEENVMAWAFKILLLLLAFSTFVLAPYQEFLESEAKTTALKKALEKGPTFYKARFAYQDEGYLAFNRLRFDLTLKNYGDFAAEDTEVLFAFATERNEGYSVKVSKVSAAGLVPSGQTLSLVIAAEFEEANANAISDAPTSTHAPPPPAPSTTSLDTDSSGVTPPDFQGPQLPPPPSIPTGLHIVEYFIDYVVFVAVRHKHPFTHERTAYPVFTEISKWDLINSHGNAFHPISLEQKDVFEKVFANVFEEFKNNP